STVSYPNGMQVLYDYYGATGDFLLKQIKNMSAGASPSVISQFDYTYRQDRSVDTWTVEQGSGPTTWTFGYDAARELTSAKRYSGSTLLESPYYGYDKAGNRVQVGTGAAPPKNYDVNNLNQLLSERDHGRTTFSGFVDEPATVKVNGKAAKVTSTDGGAPYRFEGVVDLGAGANTVVVEAKDGQNNVATKTYAVTTTGTSKTFEYDANGNLRYEKQPNGTVIREYRWDQQNRLVRAVIGTHESVYEYDGTSRRVRIKELESSVETKNETFIWCRSRICQKRSGSTVLRSYFSEGFEQNATDDYFYTRDHLGSVREVVASDGTTIASRVAYDPWGKATESGSGAVSDFAFTGHFLDRPTGLSLTWFRGYDPNLGRWLSKDPLGRRADLYGPSGDQLLGPGRNLYAYVGNQPEDLSDPLGLHPYSGDDPPGRRPGQGDTCGNGYCMGVALERYVECRAPRSPLSWSYRPDPGHGTCLFVAIQVYLECVEPSHPDIDF
ncbi:MAG TPA: RHS repeat-associated core domain-containing protein, partial [Labilithrix sp.]|nr:RHS repeat-associated core domain-containing protein [Labilithrix sp.]